MKSAIQLLAVALVLSSVQAKDRVSGPEGKVYVYKEVNGTPRELEVYFPKDHDSNSKRVPGVIFFHGGGWGGGSRSAFSYQCHYFASRGLVAATVTYRLVTREERASMKGKLSPKRLCMPDAKSAIRWFKQHADELGVDPDRVIAGGGSAGGHISLVATNHPGFNSPGDPKDIDTSVAAMVLFNPALSESDSRDPDIDVIQLISPPMPPAIAFFGTKDKWLKGWNPASKKWKSFEGARLEVEMAEGEGHAFFNYQPWADLTLISADRFLAELGFLEGKPTLALPDSGERLVPLDD